MNHLLLLFAVIPLSSGQSEYQDYFEARRRTRLNTLLSTLNLYFAGERPVSEHLIPPVLQAEAPSFVEGKTAVVVPAARDADLQVAKRGSKVFVTEGRPEGGRLKFVPHHHPSLRTVDLAALADEVNLIFAHPRAYTGEHPVDKAWEDRFEDELQWARSRTAEPHLHKRKPKFLPQNVIHINQYQNAQAHSSPVGYVKEPVGAPRAVKRSPRGATFSTFQRPNYNFQPIRAQTVPFFRSADEPEDDEPSNFDHVRVFEPAEQDPPDEIPELFFVDEFRSAEAEPHLHRGSHFVLHQHGFVPSGHRFQEAVVAPVRTFGVGLHAAQASDVGGVGNLVNQNQQVAHGGGGLFGAGGSPVAFHPSGQNVHVSGSANSASQSQSALLPQVAFDVRGGQFAQISGSSNSVAQSQAHRRRRSLVELLKDPNVKLDVPKTIRNIGTVAKASFDDQRKPMYHLNNMGLIIPSQYKIVNDLEAKKQARSINQNLFPPEGQLPNTPPENGDPLRIVDTFSRVGSAIRDSIQSGQETLAHVGEIAHSARQVLRTAKTSAPRALRPKGTRRIMLVTPKVLELKKEDSERLRQPQRRGDFVKAGDLIDALGVSDPDRDTVDVKKIVVHREGELKDYVAKMKNEFDVLLKDKLKQERKEKKLRKAMRKLDRRGDPLVRLRSKPLDNVLGQLQDHADVVRTKGDRVIDALQTVNGKLVDTFRAITSTDPETAVGAPNFHEGEKPTARLKSAGDGSDSWEEQVGSFLSDLFEDKEEVVGAPQFGNGLNLRPDLLKPFMGRPSKAALRKFLEERGDSVEDDVVGAAPARNGTEPDGEQARRAQKVLGAINPLMFEKLFNETMGGSDGRPVTPYEAFTAGRNKSEEQVCGLPEKVGTSMKVTRLLRKPFMGRTKGTDYIEVLPFEPDEQGNYYVTKD